MAHHIGELKGLPVGGDIRRPKPGEIKLKTAKKGGRRASTGASTLGLVTDPPGPRSHKPTLPENATVDPNRDHRVYLTVAGRKAALYSDLDLHGVYGAKGSDGKRPLVPFNDPANRAVLNGHIDEAAGIPEGKSLQLVQHGSHDEWGKRDDESAGPNRGAQPGVTVYMPDGKAASFKTTKEMHDYYDQHGIRWPYKEALE
jgi:hypothetical protein